MALRLRLLLLLMICGFAQCNRQAAHTDNTNKFRQRQASDDNLPFPVLEETTLTNTQCPQHVELRWQTEVTSTVYATPLIADINNDGKLEVVVPSFVHSIDILDGCDGERVPGWPASHQSTSHSSPLLYDIDNDGMREIVMATYNGEVLFFRSSGYLSMEKLVLPRERVRKNWYVGVEPDHADRSHPDVHDDSLIAESWSQPLSQNYGASNVSFANETIITGNNKAITRKESGPANDDRIIEDIKQVGLEGSGLDMAAASLNGSDGAMHAAQQRRLLEDNKTSEEHESVPTAENDQETLEDATDASFNVFRDEEENMEDGLTEEYQYDYDDYVDESMWGDENWRESEHEKEEDYVNIDAHILCTPVIADIDRDGIDEMVIATSHFYDREYYNKPENAHELGGIDVSKYVAGSVVVFNLATKQVKWKKLLDLSTDNGIYQAYIYSSPTLIDLDNDGFLDILIGTSFGFFYALDHRGEFRENFPLQMAEIQAQILAADVNDDGKIELVTTDARGNVAAWTSQGKEIWEVHLKSLIAQHPTVGDVDGDGKTDIVVSTVSGNIYVLKGVDGSYVKPYPFRTNGRLMAPVTLVDLSKPGDERKALTLVVTSFDGYLYLIDGPTACADVIDVGETSYSMVLADNIDGGDDLDLIVTTMNGNVFCFSTPAPYHPLKAWPSQLQGRNVPSVRHRREGIFVLASSRAFRDEGGDKFWVQYSIVDEHRLPSGTQAPYNVTATLLVPNNYVGPRKFSQTQIIGQSGRHQLKMPCVTVRSSGLLVLEMVDKNGLYFTDEFALTFHMHYYRLLKWLVLLPMLGMLCMLLWLHPNDGSVLPSLSRDCV